MALVLSGITRDKRLTERTAQEPAMIPNSSIKRIPASELVKDGTIVCSGFHPAANGILERAHYTGGTIAYYATVQSSEKNLPLWSNQEGGPI